MAPRDQRGDRQPKAGTRPLDAVGPAIEALEDLLTDRLWRARARVAHDDLRAVARMTDSDVHGPPLRSVHERVVDQVAQRAAQLRRVAAHRRPVGVAHYDA